MGLRSHSGRVNGRVTFVALLMCAWGQVYGQAFEEILALQPGETDGQVGIVLGDLQAYDVLPEIHVDGTGTIVIADSINGRVQVFSANGDFLNSIGPIPGQSSLLFPEDVVLLSGDRFIAQSRSTITQYDYQGDVLASVSNVEGVIESQLHSDTIILRQPGQSSFHIYATGLAYQGTGTDLPDDWYRQSESGSDDGAVLRRYEFPDRCYAVRDTGANLVDAQRLGGLLYLVGDTEVWVIDESDQVQASAVIPEEIPGDSELDDDQDPAGGDFEPSVESAYITLSVGKDGTMYSIHRTGDAFSFGKWDLSQLPPASNAIQPVVSDLALAPLASRELAVGTSLRIRLAYSGGSGRDVQFNATGLPAGASFDEVLGIFEWTPLVSDLGQREIEFSVQDDECGFDRRLLVVDVIE